MSFIIAHIEDPMDVDSIDILPDEEGFAIKTFKTKQEACRYLESIDIHPVTLFNSDIIVTRLH
jgi:hypothetical protein